ALRKKELSLIRNYWDCDPMIYYMYRLFDRTLSEEELLDYIPPYFFYNKYLPSIYSDGKAFELASSKNKQHDFFNSKQINTPVRIAYVISGKLYDNKNGQSDFEKLVLDINNSDSRVFFMKPDDGRGGQGIFRIEKKSGKLFINSHVLTRKMFLSIIKNKNLIIQEGIIQRKDFMEIYSYSVNTLRTVTQNFNNCTRIIAVVLRMGRKGLFVDNISSGGIFVLVDHETGLLSPLAQGWLDKRKFEAHPDTGFRFDGYKIEGWDKIKESIIKMASSAPELPDIAWDVTVTDKGTMAIELNLNYGIDSLQRCIGGMRRKLNVKPFSESVR
ncbi:MAG TPA: sugar-transfer associated ATP-grasp domain-containing protein, partial [Bacteroidales bacterium]|nr:sugar-transfer associated ATP-grasp domain-containing protein [Bacteroidales bacterium]